MATLRKRKAITPVEPDGVKRSKTIKRSRNVKSAAEKTYEYPRQPSRKTSKGNNRLSRPDQTLGKNFTANEAHPSSQPRIRKVRPKKPSLISRGSSQTPGSVRGKQEALPLEKKPSGLPCPRYSRTQDWIQNTPDWTQPTPQEVSENMTSTSTSTRSPYHPNFGALLEEHGIYLPIQSKHTPKNVGDISRALDSTRSSPEPADEQCISILSALEEARTVNEKTYVIQALYPHLFSLTEEILKGRFKIFEDVAFPADQQLTALGRPQPDTAVGYHR
jgi:hypothetical protein